LPCFARDYIGDLVATGENRIAEATQRGGAFSERVGGPFFLRFAGTGKDRGQVAGLGDFKSSIYLLRRRIDGFDGGRGAQRWCGEL
ncbi:MAG: hypothetical protein WA224_23880, partial [Candidatus Acidiferrales bacterium]